MPFINPFSGKKMKGFSSVDILQLCKDVTEEKK